MITMSTTAANAVTTTAQSIIVGETEETPEISGNCNPDCCSCGGNCPCCNGEKPDFSAPVDVNSHGKTIIGAVSGKGGVGKSVITSLMSAQMRRRSHSVATLNADFTGPAA